MKIFRRRNSSIPDETQDLSFMIWLLHLSLETLCWPLYLHGADAEAPVDHKLAEGCRSLVAVPSMDHEQTPQVLELSDGEISCQRCLLPFLGTRARKSTVSSFQHWKQRILCCYWVITDRISRNICSLLLEGEHCLSTSPSTVGFKQRAKIWGAFPFEPWPPTASNLWILIHSTLVNVTLLSRQCWAQTLSLKSSHNFGWLQAESVCCCQSSPAAPHSSRCRNQSSNPEFGLQTDTNSF